MIMKKYLKIMSLAVVIMTTILSCDLNKYPYDSIEQSQAFQSVKDATTFDNGLYAYLRGRVYGIYTFSTDVQADFLNATLDYGNRNGFPHKWNGFLADDYTIRDTWSGYYGALTNVNNFINNVDRIKIPYYYTSASVNSKADSALVSKYKGEAYLMRAFFYHQLVLRWAKAYDPATAAADLGVPLVLTFDITLRPARATVAATYAQILADIAKAKTLLAPVPAAQSSAKLTLDCAIAMEARVALCMQNWTLALTASNTLISSGAYPLINNAVALKTMWVNDASTEVIFQPFSAQPNELPNTNNIYLGLVAGKTYYTPDFLPEQWVIDMYSDLDFRKAIYLEKKTVFIQGIQYPNIYCVNKYSGNPALFTAATTNYAHKPKVFRIAEMYLISAEAAAQTPAGEAAALATLNLLKVARGIPAVTGLSGAALMAEIQAERTRELFCEGFRIDDLKRWKQGFSRKPPQNVNTVNVTPGDDFSTKTVLAGDPKFVWGIPSNDLSTNPNLVQNIGW
jgi:hypothetical protein